MQKPDQPMADDKAPPQASFHMQFPSTQAPPYTQQTSDSPGQLQQQQFRPQQQSEVPYDANYRGSWLGTPPQSQPQSQPHFDVTLHQLQMQQQQLQQQQRDLQQRLEMYQFQQMQQRQQQQQQQHQQEEEQQQSQRQNQHLPGLGEQRQRYLRERATSGPSSFSNSQIDSPRFPSDSPAACSSSSQQPVALPMPIPRRRDRSASRSFPPPGCVLPLNQAILEQTQVQAQMMIPGTNSSFSSAPLSRSTSAVFSTHSRFVHPQNSQLPWGSAMAMPPQQPLPDLRKQVLVRQMNQHHQHYGATHAHGVTTDARGTTMQQMIPGSPVSPWPSSHSAGSLSSGESGEQTPTPTTCDSLDLHRGNEYAGLTFQRLFGKVSPLDRIRVWVDRSGNNMFDCVCGKRSPNISVQKLKRHAYRHSVSSYTCDLCGKVFKQHWSLNAHKRVHKD